MIVSQSRILHAAQLRKSSEQVKNAVRHTAKAAAWFTGVGEVDLQRRTTRPSRLHRDPKSSASGCILMDSFLAGRRARAELMLSLHSRHRFLTPDNKKRKHNSGSALDHSRSWAEVETSTNLRTRTRVQVKSTPDARQRKNRCILLWELVVKRGRKTGRRR